MDEDILREISTKLDVLIRLSALEAVKGRELKEQVRLLDQANMKPKEIGSILGKTPNAVSIMLFRIRKEGGKEAKEEAEDAQNG